MKIKIVATTDGVGNKLLQPKRNCLRLSKTHDYIAQILLTISPYRIW